MKKASSIGDNLQLTEKGMFIVKSIRSHWLTDFYIMLPFHLEVICSCHYICNFCYLVLCVFVFQAQNTAGPQKELSRLYFNSLLQVSHDVFKYFLVF